MQTNALLHTVLPPIHLFTYSTILGMELYQTFAITKITYQTLSRTAFTTLQKRLFPIYFQSQSLLLVILAATYPPYGLISVIEKKKDWVSFAIAAMTVGLNLTIYGPRTKNLMIERIHQGKCIADTHYSRAVTVRAVYRGPIDATLGVLLVVRG